MQDTAPDESEQGPCVEPRDARLLAREAGSKRERAVAHALSYRRLRRTHGRAGARANTQLSPTRVVAKSPRTPFCSKPPVFHRIEGTASLLGQRRPSHTGRCGQDPRFAETCLLAETPSLKRREHKMAKNFQGGSMCLIRECAKSFYFTIKRKVLSRPAFPSRKRQALSKTQTSPHANKAKVFFFRRVSTQSFRGCRGC